MQNDDDRKDDGSIWTSYSDLFTTVAVIFLVMFVFALVKAGVSKMQQVVEKNRHEQELKGKVSEHVKKQTDKKIHQVESTLDEMTAYENLVNQKMLEMNQFVANLKENKKVMHELIEDQKRKEAQLEVVNQVVQKHEEEIKTRELIQNELEEKLNQKLAELTQTHKVAEEQKQKLANLEKIINSQKDNLSKVANEKTALDEELQKTQKVVESVQLEKQQRDFKIKDLETSIQKINEQNKSKVEQLVSEIQKLEQKEKELLMESQLKQDAIAELTHKNTQKELLIKNQKVELEKNQKLISNHEQKISEQMMALKDLQENQNQQLIKLKNQEEQIAKYESNNKQLVAQNEKIKSENKELVEQKSEIEKTNQSLKLVNNQLLFDKKQQDEQLKNLIAKNDSFQKTISDKNIDIQTLNASLSTSRAKMAGLEEQLKVSQSEVARAQNETKNIRQNMDGLKQAHLRNKQQLAGAQAQLTSLQETNAKLNADLLTLQQNHGQNSRQIASVAQEVEELKNSNQEKEKELISCQSEKDGAIKTNEHLKESLSDFATKVANVKGKLRSSIAEDLAKAFSNAKLNVMVDKKTGNIVFLMDKNFRFEKNSAYLNKAARNTLNKIIPIYSQVLFGNQGIKDKIAGFNIVGHASPSHRGKYVEPTSENVAAYSYNMKLSAERAASVANYIFSEHIGKYQHKSELKEFTSSIGQGFTKPIKKEGRSVASKSACGPYDCHASQRVEISFTLKDDVDSINKLIQMAKDIK